jgi:phosphoserine aminotransferase
MDRKIRNFYAGPAILPRPVLEKAQQEMLNFNSTGMSVMELSHRSKTFKDVIETAERDFRQLLSIPPNYKVLFMQGGATTQFSAVLYNMVTDLEQPIDYIVTGQWSAQAFKEAKRLGLLYLK